MGKRTNIVIDDDLMARAMCVAGTTTMRETVERGLRALVEEADDEARYRAQLGVLDLFGACQWGWEPNETLDDMRTVPPGQHGQWW